METEVKKNTPKNAGHDSVAGGDCTPEQQAFMPLIFRDFIPARAAHCPLGSAAAGSHTSWKWSTFLVAVLNEFCLLCHKSWALTGFPLEVAD